MRRAGLLLLAVLTGGAGPGEDRIALYCGGGVTGGGGGVAALPDGTLLRLRRPRAGAPMDEQRAAAAAPFARWQGMLDAAGFARMPRGAPSNMTCGLTRIRGGQRHEVLWGIGREPPALREVVREMREAARE